MERGPVERKLAAILHADVVGYSRLMGEDEDATHRVLKDHLDAIADLIRRHNGEIANIAGDAVLAVYPSVVEAVHCAVNIQAMLRERNAELPDSRKLRFRIGINIGDIIFDSDSVYGDGVNVAARLEGLAEPDGICISQNVYEQVRRKLQYGFEFAGNQQVKNIAEPVGVWRVVTDGSGRPAVSNPGLVRSAATGSRRRVAAIALGAVILVAGGAWLLSGPRLVALDPGTQASRSENLPSIAVLPFDNLSNDTEQSWFADGITDDLITDLTKISGLLVIARDSTFAYRGDRLDINEIARKLNVRYILHGSIRRADNQVRVNAQLTDVATGSHLWAERYDGDTTRIFAVQDEVTRNIVSALSVTLTSGEQTSLAHQDTANLEAYDYFLKGQQHFFRHSLSDNREAQALYTRALQLDPEFARVYAMLALTQWFEFANGWAGDPEQALDRAREYALAALARNDALPIAYFVNGLVFRERKQYEQAQTEAEKAILLDPNYANGRVLLASVLYYTGHAREGLQLMEEAKRLNPHYPHNYPFHVGQAYFIMGDYKKAIAVFKDGLTRNPTSQRLRLWLVAAYAQNGQTEDAQWEMQEIYLQDPGFSIDRIAGSYPFKFHADLENFLDGLHKAGL